MSTPSLSPTVRDSGLSPVHVDIAYTPDGALFESRYFDNLRLPDFDDMSQLRALITLIEYGKLDLDSGFVRADGWSRNWLMDRGMSDARARRGVRWLEETGIVQVSYGSQGAAAGKAAALVAMPIRLAWLGAAGTFTPWGQHLDIHAMKPLLSSYTPPAPRSGDARTPGIACTVCGAWPRRDPNLWTYFVQRSGYVKIGSASNVTRRLRVLAAVDPGVITPPDFDHAAPTTLLGAIKTPEHEVHGWFADLHVAGEWFRLTDDLVRVATSGDA